MSGKYYVHVMPHFHHDVAYLKTYEEYLPICFDNLLEMLNLMQRFPQYTFVIEQAILLQEFWQKFPEHREKLKELVQQGRIEIAPGMYTVPDMNIPSGESLIRQILIGKRWIKRNLGVEPRTAHIADSFGYHAQLPQIFKKCGYDYFLFHRGIDRLDRKTEFYWQGLDGTQILSHWMAQGYGPLIFNKNIDVELNELTSDSEVIEKEFNKIKEATQKAKKQATTNQLLLANGGDFRKPQQCAPLIIARWNKSNDDIQLAFSTPVKFFEALLGNKPDLEVLQEELNPILRGVYSSRIKIKQWNRKLENKVITAEKLATLSSLFGGEYPLKELDEAWQHLLFNQFHDIISGTIIDSAYSEAITKYKFAHAMLDRIITERLDFLAKKIATQTQAQEKVVLIFNPLSWDREDVVSVKISVSKQGVKGFRVVNDEGKEIPVQIIERQYYDSSNNNLKEAALLFIARVPSLGFREFEIQETEEELNYTSNLRVSETELENKFYKIKLGRGGTISSLVLKDQKIEFVDPYRPFFNNLVFQLDFGDLWLYYEAPIRGNVTLADKRNKDPLPPESTSDGYIVKHGLFSKDVDATVEVVETGPVRAVIKVSAALRFWSIICRFTQFIYLYNDLKRIDFRTDFLPRGKDYRIRVCFPTHIKEGKIRHEIPFGIQERPEGEYPAQNWIEYSDDKKGLCILNQGLPGNNVVEGVAMISLFRAVAMEYKGPSVDAYGEGVPHSWGYSIIPFLKNDQEYRPYKIGYEINNPLISRIVACMRGHLPRKSSFLTIEPEHVIMSALKKGGNGKIILRVYEAAGKAANARIRFPFQLKSCEETDCLEQTIREIQLKDNGIEFEIGPFEIKTFAFVMEET